MKKAINPIARIVYTTIFLVLASSCSEDDSIISEQSEEIQEEMPMDPVDQVFDFTETLIHDNEVRSYRVHLPVNYYENPIDYPVVLGFHGGGGNAAQFEAVTALSDYADQQNFIAVYPNGLVIPNTNGIQTWNAGNCCGLNSDIGIGTDDIGFVSSLIDTLINAYTVNPDRIYATGQSNGGMLTYRLMCELNSKIAAFAPSSCANFFEGSCDISSAPLLHIHSELDTVAPYLGGTSSQTGIEYPVVEDQLNDFASLNNCDLQKTITFENDLYRIFEWENCTEAEVLFYLTKDGGHSWAGAIDGFDPPSQAFVANEVIWQFFSQYSL